MAEKLNEKQTVTIEELLISNIYEQEALVNVLARKGLITREEVIDEIKRLKAAALKTR